MTWNYRVVRKFTEQRETYYQIHEVYYNEDGKIMSMTENGIAPLGETTTELQLELTRMLDALKKPVLDYGVTDGEPDDWSDAGDWED